MKTKDKVVSVITVKGISAFGVLDTNEKWHNPKKGIISPSQFERGKTYEITEEEWSKGEKSGYNIVSYKDVTGNVTAPAVKVSRTPSKENIDEIVQVMKTDTAPLVSSYEENKNRKILVQGITQAAMVSPGVAGLQAENDVQLTDNFKRVADEMIRYVEDKLAGK